MILEPPQEADRQIQDIDALFFQRCPGVALQAEQSPLKNPRGKARRQPTLLARAGRTIFSDTERRLPAVTNQNMEDRVGITQDLDRFRFGGAARRVDEPIPAASIQERLAGTLQFATEGGLESRRCREDTLIHNKENNVTRSLSMTGAALKRQFEYDFCSFGS